MASRNMDEVKPDVVKDQAPDCRKRAAHLLIDNVVVDESKRSKKMADAGEDSSGIRRASDRNPAFFLTPSKRVRRDPVSTCRTGAQMRFESGSQGPPETDPPNQDPAGEPETRATAAAATVDRPTVAEPIEELEASTTGGTGNSSNGSSCKAGSVDEKSNGPATSDRTQTESGAEADPHLLVPADGTANEGPDSGSSDVSPTPSPGGSVDGNDGERKKRNRCGVCKKRVGLTGFGCRCGGLFCAVHRYSDKHECSFDYKTHGAEEIRKNNPVVVGEKIQHI
ncbi:unnamed protein product [Cyprideis torosa]|uniref:Uncharacterized protein n=1 Tax=Cyprideis torosa TaxID=163714 RepID=A0A7R8W165_9CRUS|nr:unnamed protein product [Cyprideis torosa]CAG0880574.1 unnamed protein product [Cyprideis torosa]